MYVRYFCLPEICKICDRVLNLQSLAKRRGVLYTHVVELVDTLL